MTRKWSMLINIKGRELSKQTFQILFFILDLQIYLFIFEVGPVLLLLSWSDHTTLSSPKNKKENDTYGKTNTSKISCLWRKSYYQIIKIPRLADSNQKNALTFLQLVLKFHSLQVTDEYLHEWHRTSNLTTKVCLRVVFMDKVDEPTILSAKVTSDTLPFEGDFLVKRPPTGANQLGLST